LLLVRRAFIFLPRLLVAIAVLGMLAAPYGPQVLAAAPAAQATMAETMPCCPDQPAQDCTKQCPLMALCATQLLAGAVLVADSASMILLARLMPASDPPLAGLGAHPPPKPPRSFG